MIATAVAPTRSTYPIVTSLGTVTVSFSRDGPTGPAKVAVSSALLLINNIEVAAELIVDLPVDEGQRPWVDVRRARTEHYRFGRTADVPPKTREKAQALILDTLRDVTAGRVTANVNEAADAGFRAASAQRLAWARERGYDHERDEVVRAVRKWAQAVAERDMQQRAADGLSLNEVQRTPLDLRAALLDGLDGLLDEALTEPRYGRG
jgi:hypothetical protein